VTQKVVAAGRDWELAKALLASYDLDLEPVTVADAEWAAARWVRGDGLSLGDRLCLALGDRLAADVLTADTSWGTGERIRQIR
jgi:predicted nucleic acid-binding protein